MKTLLAALLPTVLPALLALVVPLVLMGIAKGVSLLHAARLSKDAASKSLRDKFVATLLDLVDDFASSQATALSADLTAAKADGTVTPAELAAIAKAEWARVKAYFSPDLLAAVAKALGISLEGVSALAVQTIADKLSPRLAPAK